MVRREQYCDTVWNYIKVLPCEDAGFYGASPADAEMAQDSLPRPRTVVPQTTQAL